ncbi:hypothetical protein [Demequina sp.]|uniref:hypothetical protein n=1 Tax=Demequina sp. TaxID=2050685 RepID=UPI003A849740
MGGIAFVSPFTNTENPYIARQQEQVSAVGWQVRPLSLGALVRGRCWGLASRDNVVLVSWPENRIFTVAAVSRGLSAKGLAQFLAYAAVLALARARVVYVVHDHEVHDVKASLRRWSVRAIGLLRRMADARIVHDPSFTERYDAHYVPHPLYEQLAGPLAPSMRDTPTFAAMGAVRPYKRLDAVLEAWPAGVPLTIAGKGDDDYVAQLRDIVARRGLEDTVTIDARFLSDEEFLGRLASHDVLVLPHRVGANLVSGAFFAAAGQVRVVLGRRTPFIDWVGTQMPGVEAFDGDGELGEAVLDVVRRWPDLRDVDPSAPVEALFGDAACIAAYREVLGQPRASATQAHTPEGPASASAGRVLTAEGKTHG